MTIEEQIRRYIYKEVDKLRQEGESTRLKCVYPDIIMYVLGNRNETYDVTIHNKGEYSIMIGKYKISGSMLLGIATVILLEDKI